MTVRRVILIRAGETEWNRLMRWQGWVASPLNGHGLQQVQALSHYVRHIGMSALYASDLRRAAQTAEILCQHLPFEPVYDARWRERDIGSWQGMTLEEIKAWYPQDYARLLADPDGFLVPEGESRLDVQRRVVAAFEDIVKGDVGVTVGVISHTTATHMLLKALITDYNVYGTVIGNSSVTTIARETDDAPWQMVAANDQSHLEGLLSEGFDELEREKR